MSTIVVLITGILGVTGIAVSLRKPNMTQFLFFLLIPAQSIAGVYANIGPFLAESLLYGCIAGALLRYTITKKKSPTIAWPWWIMLIVFMLSGTLATMIGGISIDVLGAWKTHIMIPVALFLAITLYPKKNLRSQLHGIIIAVIVVSTMAIIQYFVIQLRGEPWNGVQEEFRATSIFTHPNYFAMFLGPLIAYLIFFCIQIWHKINSSKQRACIIVVIGMGILAIIFSGSTGAIASLIITFLLYTIIALVQTKKTNFVIIRALGLFIAISFLFTFSASRDVLRQKLLLQENSGQIRKEIWQGAWQLIQAHPVKGVGLQHFEQEYHKLQPLSHTVQHPYPHNLFLAFWLETTLFGLLSVIAIFIYAIRTLWKCRHHQYALPVFAAIIVVGVHGLIDTPYFHPSLSLLFWFFMAQTVIIQQQSSQLLNSTSRKKEK